MAEKKGKKIKVQDLKPKKDAKGGNPGQHNPGQHNPGQRNPGPNLIGG
jgi:hypothetical protein